MEVINRIICPVSGERMDENVARFTAISVVLLMGSYFITGLAFIPALMALDFYTRGFTKLRNSPLSWISGNIIKILKLKPVLIDKGPKIFAARIGFLLTSATSLLAFLGFIKASIVTGSVLAGFAFLECGLNFCAGCWVYTFVIYPVFGRNR